MRSKSKIVARFRVLRGNDIALGPGKVALLRSLQETGSILEASKRMEMSYMRAWKLIQTMNNSFREPLVTAERGGKTRGGAQLTLAGEQVLQLYSEMEAVSLSAASQVAKKLMRMLRP